MAHDSYRALYIHIPFCVSRCGYCDFTTRAVPADSVAIDEYVEHLITDIRRLSKEGKLAAIETIYLGGGTPTHVGMRNLSKLLYALGVSLHLTPEVECTIEANPESLDERMVCDLWALGVNRISIGVQSFNDELLTILGRAHTSDQAKEAIRAAQTRFHNVSIDLMCGLPGQTCDDFLRDVQTAIDAGVTHVSIYPLTIEKHTPFARALLRGEIAEPDEDVQADMMEAASLLLTQSGFQRYEVASYARPDLESRHNTAYWTGVPYVGVGLSATTMTQNMHRRMRVKDGQVIDDLDASQMAAEDMMLGMRLARGLSDAQVEQASKLLPDAGATLERLCGQGLVEHTDGRWRPTQRGWLCGNQLYAELLDLAP